VVARWCAHKALDGMLAIKGKDVESEQAQGHFIRSSLTLYA
jgi:hypothetical protein